MNTRKIFFPLLLCVLLVIGIRSDFAVPARIAIGLIGLLMLIDVIIGLRRLSNGRKEKDAYIDRS